MKRMPRFLLRSLALLFCSVLLTLQTPAQDNGRVEAAIKANNKKFADLFTASGGTGVNVLYSQNAMVMPPAGEAVTGTENIGKFWNGAFGAGIRKVSLETRDVQATGNLAAETGMYTLYSEDGHTIDSGKYIVVWKKEGADWKMLRDIWNSSMAAK